MMTLSSLFLLLNYIAGFAQNNSIFSGGSASGNNSTCFSQNEPTPSSSPINNNLFGGGSASGSSTTCYSQNDPAPPSSPVNNNLFGGGAASGSITDCYSQNSPAISSDPLNSNIFVGGSASGDVKSCASATPLENCTGPVVFDSITTTNTTCSATSDGTATVYPSGGVGGYTYLWTLGGQTTPTATNLVTATYTITVRDTRHCITDSTITVNANSSTAAISGTTTICVGETTTLTASGGTSYLWSTGETTTSINVSPASDSSYWVTATDGPCSDNDTVLVTVNPLPTPSAGSNTPVCENGTLNLTSSGGIDYVWSGPNSFSSTSQNPSIGSVTTAATGTYTVTVTDANSCSADATTAVVINALPAATAGSNSPVCENSTLNLSSSGGTDYAWSGPNSFSSTTQNPSIGSVTVAATGTYTVTVTDANNCSADATTNVTINANPTATAGSNSPICEASTLNLTSSGGTDYAWSGPNSFSSTSQNPSIVSATTAATGTYTVTVTDGNGCSDVATTAVTVSALPTATIGSNSPVCENETINLTSSGGTSYSWAGPNSFSSTSQNPSITNATLAASGTYTVTVTVAGCSDMATTDVTVNPLPSVVISGTTTIYDGDSTILTATGGASYLWSTTSTTSSITVWPTYDSLFSVTATSAFSCIKDTSVTVTVLDASLKSIFKGGGGSGSVTSCYSQSPPASAPGPYNNNIYSGGTFAGNTFNCYSQVDPNITVGPYNNSLFEGGGNSGNVYSCYAQVDPASLIPAENNTIYYGNSGGGDYVVCTASYTDLSGLPIVLLRFDAYKEGNIVKTEWITASEINNDYFTVEKTLDALSFEEVLSMKGAGYSSMPIYYSAIDPSPYSGISYYRLKEVDYDGRYSYSQLVPVDFRTDKKEKFDVYPNPTSGDLFTVFSGMKNKIISLRLTDPLGKELYETEFVLKEDNVTYHLPVSNDLSKGVYIIKAIAGEKVYVEKVVVQ